MDAKVGSRLGYFGFFFFLWKDERERQRGCSVNTTLFYIMILVSLACGGFNFLISLPQMP